MSLVDIPSPADEDQTMEPASKDYVDARLESAEARSAASMAEFKSFVTATLARMDEREKAAESRQLEMRTQLDEYRKESKTTRKVIVATGITVLFGIAGINATMMQNFHSAFDIGQRYSGLQQKLAQMDGKLAAIEQAISEKKR